ncbi:MAG: hypothetical protein Hyperionvirus12_47 [Hyperionvirus sp.]|uniref:Uncharacterized protein n=1 Tax=Hyperionvirus sp. TaxID=2487770 RepID=A0A3G5A9B4_9VIRU|nr:MAG: hypothetical protein Hyperionvirus12_47 [Hyperionvirus sp.]
MPKEKLLVSGPVNVVRLSGNIFGINKIIYIFYDVHMFCEYESSCNDINALTITQYLYKEFKNINANDTFYDFFLETFPTGLQYTSNYRDRYLNELRRFFAQGFSYEKSVDKVAESKVFPKVRLHYIDIRDYLFWDILWNETGEVKSYLEDIPDVNKAKFCIERVGILLQDLEYVNELVFGKQVPTGGARLIRPLPENRSLFGKLEVEKAAALINKIKNNYKHPEIKRMVHTILDDYFRVGIKSAMDKLVSMIKLLETLEKKLSVKYIEINPDPAQNVKDMPAFCTHLPYGPNFHVTREIENSVNELMDKVSVICKSSSAVIMDAYFIRRFLDKDYVTKSVSYTGGAHSQMYVHILSKYFDFKITHVSYSKYDIATLNDKIKKIELGYEFDKLFWPPILIQCSDLTDFPQNFE